MDNYQRFCEGIRTLLALISRMPDAVVYDYTSETKPDHIQDYLHLLQILPDTKVFELDPNLAKMLLLTKNRVVPVKLPYPDIFIETRLELENVYIPRGDGTQYKVPKVTYHGLFLEEAPHIVLKQKFKALEGKEIVEENFPNIFMWSIFENPLIGGEGEIKISLYREYEEIYGRGSPFWQKEKDFLRNFVMNFLDFLNDPEVKLVEILRSPKTDLKRGRHGKMPLPSSTKIRITGVLKQYVDQLHLGRHFSYSHRFWVRGHWRHLQDKRWKAKRGMKIWIPPFVKGTGILVPKRYQLIDKRKEVTK